MPHSSQSSWAKTAIAVTCVVAVVFTLVVFLFRRTPPILPAVKTEEEKDFDLYKKEIEKFQQQLSDAQAIMAPNINQPTKENNEKLLGILQQLKSNPSVQLSAEVQGKVNAFENAQNEKIRQQQDELVRQSEEKDRIKSEILNNPGTKLSDLWYKIESRNAELNKTLTELKKVADCITVYTNAGARNLVYSLEELSKLETGKKVDSQFLEKDIQPPQDEFKEGYDLLIELCTKEVLTNKWAQVKKTQQKLKEIYATYTGLIQTLNRDLPKIGEWKEIKEQTARATSSAGK